MKKGKTSGIIKIVMYLLALAINAGIYFVIYWFYTKESGIIAMIFNFTLMATFIFYIVYRKDNTSFKLSWVIFTIFLPVTAIFMYLITYKGFYNKTQTEHKNRILKETKDILGENNFDIPSEIQTQVGLINNLSSFRAYENTNVQYLEIGERMHQVMLDEMKKAEKFIYLEYFIVSKSSMVDEILEILFDKASKGVEIKMMYDSAGSGTTVPKDLVSTCESHGVKCVPFNPFNSSIYKYASYRDHRKMTIIDGNVCISGGINLADEYVNRIERFGHWKDTAVILKGEAVYSFTTMFLKMWEFVTGEEIDIASRKPQIKVEDKSIVMPYGDGPDNPENPAINLYLQMILNAKDYLYIATPYLILDDDLTTALALSAKSGVDVRIIVPGIPDKKFIYSVTRSNYAPLIKSGVKIYEYTPGFIHCKSVLFDDTTYTVGSINFDFRSLFWNYECATWVYNSESYKDLKADFEDMFAKSKMIDITNYNGMSFSKKVGNAALKAISPLL